MLLYLTTLYKILTVSSMDCKQDLNLNSQPLTASVLLTLLLLSGWPGSNWRPLVSKTSNLPLIYIPFHTVPFFAVYGDNHSASRRWDLNPRVLVSKTSQINQTPVLLVLCMTTITSSQNSCTNSCWIFVVPHRIEL